MPQLPSYELSDRLAEVAGPDVAHAYREALYVHYWLWKWLGTSDQPSLAYLRNVLLDHGLVELNPDPGWVIDRGLASYTEGLGPLFAADIDEVQRQGIALSGRTPPTEPPVLFDSGSGNCRAIYELARPWLRCAGSGLALIFGVDGTMRNWLHEPLRGDVVSAYGSELLESTLKRSEIYSVARFVAGWADEDQFDPYAELQTFTDASASVIPARVLERISAATGVEIERLRSRDIDGNKLAASVALGFLLDALAGRVAVPNGMQFFYAWDDLAPDVVAGIERALVEFTPPTRSRDELLAAKPELERASRLVEEHLGNDSLPPDADHDLSPSLPRLGDLLRRAGFELRECGVDERLIQGLHAVGNAFWCWHFFLEDLQRWPPKPTLAPSSYQARKVVRAWLERPWGILRIDDMRIALGGPPEAGQAPRLLGPLLPLLRHGVAAFFDDVFPSEPDVERRLERLIAQRCQLRDLRRSIQTVSHEKSEEAELAALVVDLLTSWFYSRLEEQRRALVVAGLEPLRAALAAGNWVDDVEAEPELRLLSRRQKLLLARYRAAPAKVTRELFEFADESRITDRLDVYPPEEFWVWTS
jgi:hypothetical protein